MEIITRTDIITHKVLNEDSGELEPKDFKQVKEYKKIKGGFAMMYYKNYDAVLEAVITSKKDMELFNHIRGKFTYARIEVVLSTADVATEVGISKPKVSRFIKQLLELNFLHRVGRGTYRMNPFIFLPYRSNAEELQAEWNKLKKENK